MTPAQSLLSLTTHYHHHLHRRSNTQPYLPLAPLLYHGTCSRVQQVLSFLVEAVLIPVLTLSGWVHWAGPTPSWASVSVLCRQGVLRLHITGLLTGSAVALLDGTWCEAWTLKTLPPGRGAGQQEGREKWALALEAAFPQGLYCYRF